MTAYAFRHDGVFCHLHTHNRAFPLLQTSYIAEGTVTHDITRTKRERGSVLGEEVTQVKHSGQYRYTMVLPKSDFYHV